MPLSEQLKAKRYQVLFTSLATYASAAFCELPDFPFSPNLKYVALLSGTAHLLLFGLLDFVRPVHLQLLNFFNIGLMGLTVHYTGGIASPFVVLFVCLLMAGIAAGIEHKATLPALILTYVAVVALEFSGAVEPFDVSASDIYASGWMTWFTCAVAAVVFAISGNFYDIILRQLRARVEAEQSQKGDLVVRMSRLENTAELGGMVAKIAHDLQGPLTAIAGFVEVLKGNPRLDEETKEDCQVILSESERIAGMISRMLKFVKPGEGERGPISPRDLMETTLRVIQFHPKSRGVRFERRFEEDPRAVLHASKEALQQVYFNILKNALEAMSGRVGRGFIEVRLASENGSCVIEIADNGPGMSPDALARVEKGFHSTKRDGTGLGLMITREILAAHGGSLEIRSEEGKGTVVRTSLPASS